MRTLYKIQDETIKKIISNNYLGIFNECGTGKTYTMLYALKCIGQKFLVVCPLSIMDWWINEAKELNMSIVKIYGDRRTKMDIIYRTHHCDGFVINYDGLQTFTAPIIYKGRNAIDTSILRDFIRQNEIKVLVCDESTYIKHRNKRFKILRALIGLFERRYIMTGTPVTNSLLDLWTQIYILDYGERLGKYYAHYLKEYFYCSNPQFYKYEPLSYANELITRKIQNIQVRYTLNDIDATEIPEQIIYSIKYAYLDDTTRQYYKKFLKECIIKIRNNTITAVNSGAMFQKLLEITSGFVYDDNNNSVYFDISKAKVVQDILQFEIPDKQAIVFYNFNGELNMLKTILYDYEYINSDISEKERNEIIQNFKYNKFRILVAHSRTLGYGVNLQNASAIIWISPPTSLEVFQQANSRVYRLGQKEKRVLCLLITTPDLIDAKIYQRLKEKEEIQSEFLNIIKESANEQVQDMS